MLIWAHGSGQLSVCVGACVCVRKGRADKKKKEEMERKGNDAERERVVCKRGNSKRQRGN